MQDRRARRSERRDLALSYQLASAAERAGADFMLVCDQDGLLLATSAEAGVDGEEVAARLACLKLCEDSVGEVWREDRTLAALSFVACGQRLLIGAGGSSVDGALPEMRRAIEGAVRILT